MSDGHPCRAAGLEARENAGLTARERQVVRILADGDSVAEVADKLVMCIATARTHVKSIHYKTGTHTVGGLVPWAHTHRCQWD